MNQQYEENACESVRTCEGGPGVFVVVVVLANTSKDSGGGTHTSSNSINELCLCKVGKRFTHDGVINAMNWAPRSDCKAVLSAPFASVLKALWGLHV